MDLTKYNKSILHIDSQDRTSGEIYDFIINLEFHRHEVKFMELLSCEIPNVIPSIRDNYNNKFYFEDNGGNIRTFLIEEGTYTIQQLMTKLKTNMDSFSNGIYTISYNENTYKINISSSSNFKLLLSNNIESIWSLLGFTSNIDKTGSSSYIADAVFDLSGKNYIYLNSSLILGCIGDSVLSTNSNKRTFLSCLAKISITTSFGEIEHYRPPSKILYKVDHKHISNISFFLQDNNGNPMKLSRDYSISIILYSVPKFPHYNFLNVK